MIDEQFFTSIGMADADPKTKQELNDQLTELIQNRLAVSLAEALTTEQLEKVDGLLEDNKDDEADAYIREVLPNYDQILSDEVAEVKSAFVADMGQLLDQHGPEEEPASS